MKNFTKYCTKVGDEPSSCHQNIVVNFLTMLVREKGMLYQMVCGYGSAISKQHKGFNGIPLGHLLEIKKLVRAIFIKKPPLPRYSEIWDVDKVLSYLANGPSLARLSNMEVAQRTVTLTFILTLSRSGYLIMNAMRMNDYFNFTMFELIISDF